MSQKKILKNFVKIYLKKVSVLLEPMNNSSIVVGIKSFSLSHDEKRYFKKFKPLGVILFKRNILNKKQVILFNKRCQKYSWAKCSNNDRPRRRKSI